MRPSTALALLAFCLSPLAAALTPVSAAVVYSDSFDSVGGWPDSDATGDLDAVYTVVGGEYLINPLQDRRYALAMAPASTGSGDQAVEADIRLSASNPDSRAGVACRVGAGLNFYAFNLINAGGFEIVRVRDGQPEVLRSGGLGVDPSEGVRVRAECRGNALSFWVNGSELAAVSDAGLPPAQGAGLISVSPVIAATNAAFDNFALSDLQGRGGQSNAYRQPQSPPPQAVPTSRPNVSANGGAGNGYGANLPPVEDIAIYDAGYDEPGSKRTVFDAATQRIYLVAEFAGAARANFRVEWRAINGSDEAVILNSEFQNSAGHPRIWLYADRTWNAGLYRADLYADGRLVDQREFSVF
jgi:hypothetical protein